MTDGTTAGGKAPWTAPGAAGAAVLLGLAALVHAPALLGAGRGGWALLAGKAPRSSCIWPRPWEPC